MSEDRPTPPHMALPHDVIALLPMRNFVLFPHTLAPLTLGRPKSIAALRQAVATGTPLGVVLQKRADEDDPGLDGLCEVGALANVVQHQAARPDNHQAICQGLQRIRLLGAVEGYPFLAARFARIDEPTALSTEGEALVTQLRERVLELLQLLPAAPAELIHMLQASGTPGELADLTASVVDTEVVEKQMLLEMAAPEARVHKLLHIISHRIEVLRLSREIGERTKEQLDDHQRRYLLRQQLQAIQKELGEGGENSEEIARLEQAIEKAGMPPEAQEHATKELRRLQQMSDGSGEYSMLLTYLDWLTELPWAAPTETPIDLDAARRTLDADHFGLDQVKRRIVEYLAVRKLNPQGRAPILCFVGPPGVGKTSLGQSIARALQRPFVRVSLGGVHDEAEMRGHRRTYIGALPGNIIQGLRKAGSRGCVMMLDEVDKLGSGARSDPSGALLEVLDPEQNSTFRDNYLALPFDLSRVLFIATANVIDAVSPPVRDRMELIELAGYTQEEKLQIAQAHLLARQREANGLQPGQCEIDAAALQAVVADYTREAGVRQLEREIGRLMRHAAMQVASGERSTVHIGAADLDAILGPAKYEREQALRRSVTGVATGLAWTPVGGDILFIEASKVAGSNRVTLTGQLGDVMKESAQAAFTLVKSRAAELGIAAAAFQDIDLHVHVPAGAIPKDGPSAGVAMFIALASLFSDRPVRHDIAMTGEISLRGLVLPVGGIKDKVLAAQRAGIATVLLPRRNMKDLRDVPGSVRNAMRFVELDTVDDAIRAALDGNPR